MSRIVREFRCTGRGTNHSSWRRIMSNRFRVPMLVAVAALGGACRNERIIEPDPTPAPSFTTLEVRPNRAELSSLVPWDSVQLSIAAWDQRGWPLAGEDAPLYYSSAPAIALVSSSG